MSIAPEIISTACGGAVIGTVWVIKTTFSNKNGNGNLSKNDHDIKCSAIQKRLDTGDIKFESLSQRIDKILEILLEKK
jgi:hypothetical protein